MSEGTILKTEDFFMRPIDVGKTGESGLNLQDMEKRMIEKAIGKNNGNLRAAAAQLGISRQTLYNKMQKQDNDQS